MGCWGAIGVSSALWAVTHAQYDFWGLSIVVLAGVLLGWARSRTQSVVVTWFMHTVLNAIAVVEAMLVAAAGWLVVSVRGDPLHIGSLALDITGIKYSA